MWTGARLHAIYAIANAPMRTFPFPHIVVERVFPDDVYQALLQHLPAEERFVRLVDTGRVGGGYSPQRLVLHSRPKDLERLDEPERAFWAAAFGALLVEEFGSAVFRKFAAVIRDRYAREQQPPDSIRWGSEASLNCDLASYALGPHTDSPAKLVSLLFYLPSDDSRPHLGTSLYLPKDRAFACKGGPHHPFARFDRVTTVPFRANTLFAFPKTDRSFHGVEAIDGAEGRRDLLQYNMRRPAE